MADWDAFSRIWILDFEFHAPSGHRPLPICVVARELRSGITQRRWLWGDALADPPAFGGSRDLVVAFYASAEMGCYQVLGWPKPAHLLDLYCEFRTLTNDGEPRGSSLLNACAAFGVDVMAATEKDAGRALAIRGGPYTGEERAQILAYCESDVTATALLFERMRSRIDGPRALLRGRSMAAFACVEHVGTPVDVPRLSQLRASWEDIQDRLIVEMDHDYHVYDGRSFRSDRFERYLVRSDIPWPRHASGVLNLQDQTFKDMAKVYPQLTDLRELRASLSKLRLHRLAVGPDGRNRTLLSPFGGQKDGKGATGRCAPSSAKYIFGPAVWVRSLIKPEPGWGLGYIDWAHQEIGIAAALSRDLALQHAYASGDPYLSFAVAAGAAPAWATKQTHEAVRDLFKTVVLGIGYGMGAETLACRIRQPPVYAQRMIRQHQDTYGQFWRWAEAAQSYATAVGSIRSRFGWCLRVTPDTRPLTLRNFPMQANGAEILRLALIRMTEADIRVCATVHDAVLIEAPLPELADTVRLAQRLMAEAGADVLTGFPLRTDATLIRHPDRYDAGDRGQKMVETLARLLPEPAAGATEAAA